MIAILHDAIDCLEKYRFATDREGQRHFEEARHWILADQADWPYSFEHICEALDLNPSSVIRRLRLRLGRTPQTSADTTPV